MTERRGVRRRAAIKAIGAGGVLGLSGCLGGGDTDGGDGDDGGDGTGDGGTTDGDGGAEGTPENIEVVLMTTQEDSLAYQMSQGVSAVFNEEVDPVRLNALPSEGSKQSMALLDRGETDMAYTELLNAGQIHDSQGDYEDNPFDNQIQQVHRFYDVQLNFMARSDEIQSVTDFPGETVRPPVLGGASRDNLLRHLSHAVDLDDVEFADMSNSEQQSAMSNNRIDAALDVRLGQGLIVPSYVEQVYNSIEGTRLVEWPDSAVESIRDDPLIFGDYYSGNEIGELGYDDPSDEVWWAEMNYLIFSNDQVSEDKVYRYMTNLWENVQAVAEYHPVLELWTDLEWLAGGLSEDIPVHPGAERFYDEQGVSV